MRQTVLAAILMTGLVAIPAGDAIADESGWTFRGFAAWIDPDVSYKDTTDDGSPVTASADSGLGLGFAFERRFSSRLGLEILVASAQPDLVLAAAMDGEEMRITDGLSMTPLMAGLTVHLTPKSTVDLWLNAGLAYVLYGDLEFTPPVGDPLRLSASNDFGWSAGVGIDIPFGDSGWAATASARYLDTSLEVQDLDDPGTVTLDADSVMGAVGVAYRF
jgi:opacity protein-like surface antigen